MAFSVVAYNNFQVWTELQTPFKACTQYREGASIDDLFHWYSPSSQLSPAPAIILAHARAPLLAARPIILDPPVHIQDQESKKRAQDYS